MTDLYLDDIFIGTVEKPKDFVNNIKAERRNGKLPSTLNINYNENFNEIYIELSKGRARRPVIVVEDGNQN